MRKRTMHPEIDLTDLVPYKEAAQQIGISLGRLYVLEKDAKFPQIHIGPNRYMRPSDIAAIREWRSNGAVNEISSLD